MFVASKLLSFAIQPLNWVFMLLGFGLLIMGLRRRLGLTLCWFALLVLTLTGWEAPPAALLRALEARYPAQSSAVVEADLNRYVGLIVLGGATESSYLWTDHGQTALNGAAERMTIPVALMQRHPHLRMIFTGGEGQLFGAGLSEAERARIFFDDMGVPAKRVVYESASRNTYENAVLSAQLPGIDPRQPWLLITSASHMPRAMATFQKAGWNVTDLSVDFSMGKQMRWTDYSLIEGAAKWQDSLHELLGLLAYRLMGRL